MNRSTLRGGLAVGLAFAAGIAMIDLLYAARSSRGSAAAPRGDLVAGIGLITFGGVLAYSVVA